MRILLPPSETKAVGGEGPPLDIASLALPALNDTRRQIAHALVALCSGEPENALPQLGIGASLAGEVDHNAQLWSSPTCPAIERYTGVLYDAFHVDSLTPAVRQRAMQRVFIGSALFGLVAAADLIPHYRLSASSTLPEVGSGLRSLWRPAMAAEIATWGQELVVDLRSESYRQLGPVPDAVTIRVEAERADGSRAVVSHHNKHHKGVLARVLATTRAEVSDVDSMLRVARRAGMRFERTSGEPHRLVMVVPS